MLHLAIESYQDLRSALFLSGETVWPLCLLYSSIAQHSQVISPD